MKKVKRKNMRVHRSGNWYNSAFGLRAANRYSSYSYYLAGRISIRFVRGKR